MEKEIFNRVFEKRTDSIKLSIDEEDKINGNRIGGYAPSFFNESVISECKLGNYFYYFTLNSDLLPIKENMEISIFYPKDFKLYNRDNKFPNFPIKCILHPSSDRGCEELIFNEFIKSKSIISFEISDDMEEVEDVEDNENVEFEPMYGSKIGGNASFLQDEILYIKSLNEKEYDFIMQFDESSYLRDQVNGNEPFNH